MQENFEKALSFVLKWEGYKSEDPNDPGGRTIFGISSRHWYKEVKEMWDMEHNKALEIAKKIYKLAYWDGAGCDEMPYPMDVVIFDTGVNLGVARALRLKDNTLNWVDVLFNRLDYYNSLKRPIFMAGWTNRVIDLYRYIKV